MVVHDEGSIDVALRLVEVGPVRYSDEYMYWVFSDRDTLEARLRSTLERGDVALVVPLGEALGDQRVARHAIQKQRKRDETAKVRKYIREHPEAVARVEKLLSEEKSAKRAGR